MYNRIVETLTPILIFVGCMCEWGACEILKFKHYKPRGFVVVMHSAIVSVGYISFVKCL